MIDLLACPRCGAGLVAAQDSLRCGGCGAAVPVFDGFPLFEERQAPARGDYEAFLEAKRFRPVFDRYAAFQPFVESTRSVLPLIPVLGEALAPGDAILDLWCRTGWTGELLAGHFPAQRVVALCPGGGDVLGYRGFAHWLPRGLRAPNLEVVFASPGGRLPFHDGAFAAVHGLDALHRYAHPDLARECLRVTRPGAPILFTHVHLTNGEPDPWFERGEAQRHGTEYARDFARLLEGDGRRAFVLSEAALSSSRVTITSEPETAHYNASVLIARREWDGRAVSPPPATIDARVLLSPLLDVDPVDGRVARSTTALAGGAGELLERHPLHARRLAPFTLDRTERMLVFAARRPRTVSEIAARVGISPASALEALVRLEARELVKLEPVSARMVELQTYYGLQRAPAPRTLAELFLDAARRHADRPLLVWSEDGSAFTYADCALLARKAAALLRARGLAPGDRFELEGARRPETFFLFWGAVLAGLVVSIVAPSRGFDEGLVDALAEADPFEGVVTGGPGADRLVLHTSGSTGAPKAVVLTDGALLGSALTFHDAYGVRAEDRVLFAGGLHTISGARNALVVPLLSGASAIFSPQAGISGALELLEVARVHGATIFSTAPAALEQLASARIDPLPALRLILSCAAPLSPDHARRVEEALQVPVLDYYGLTETAGICTAELPGAPPDRVRSIGVPTGAIVELRPDGELAVFSEHLGRYETPQPRSTVRFEDGWLLTGDFARRLPDGAIALEGRGDGLLIDRNGENLAPEALASTLRAIPEVSAARVELRSGKIAAVVTTTLPEASVRDAIAARLPAAQRPAELTIEEPAP